MELYDTTLSLHEKLEILSDAAKYDVACTSSGVDRRGKKGSLGNSCAAGICHSFAGDGRCISLLKILQSNDCIYDCKYCLSRANNDCRRATFTPEEICTLVIEFYKRNYIEGLFLSSAVYKNPTHAMELMYQTLFLLRNKYRFNGYIHVKAIPHAPDELLEQIGYLADRMSINLELPTAEGLSMLAPQKTRASILTPMRSMQQRISGYRLAIGKSATMERHRGNRYLDHSIFTDAVHIGNSSAHTNSRNTADLTHITPDMHALLTENTPISVHSQHRFSDHNKTDLDAFSISSTSAASPQNMYGHPDRPFAPAGQSTQMIIGATGETDFEILSTTQALYQNFDLKRVFYSAYIPLNEDALLPAIGTLPPLLREHRLYQADWLLRYYGFHASELLTPDRPNFNLALDPKCDWALRHLEQFPVEVACADYSTLMRVPGIGAKSALRILKARRLGPLSFDSIQKMGVVLKRAQYFITCNGKMHVPIRLDESFITRQLTATDAKANYMIAASGEIYEQLSLF